MIRYLKNKIKKYSYLLLYYIIIYTRYDLECKLFILGMSIKYLYDYFIYHDEIFNSIHSYILDLEIIEFLILYLIYRYIKRYFQK